MGEELSGGAKFGMFALGFFLGIIGILIAWLVYKDDPAKKSQALKFSIIGCVVVVVLGVIISILTTCVLGGVVAASTY